MDYNKSLSKELGPKGVRVNVVSPGWIYTEASEALVRRIAETTGGDLEAAKGQHPTGAWRHSARPSS